LKGKKGDTTIEEENNDISPEVEVYTNIWKLLAFLEYMCG
jgi:hypothetical protein